MWFKKSWLPDFKMAIKSGIFSLGIELPQRRKVRERFPIFWLFMLLLGISLANLIGKISFAAQNEPGTSRPADAPLIDV